MVTEILVIEDDDDLRDLIVAALEYEGFKTLQAKSGFEAMQLLDAGQRPRLILLDLSLPRLSGEEFMTALKCHDACLDTKVLLVSGWDGLADRARALGAAGYIRKPIDFNIFGRELRKHL